MTKNCSSEFGAMFWRHLTPQRKTAMVHNYSPSGAQELQNISENLLPV